MIAIRYSLLALLLSTVAAADAASSRIYRSVDEQGNVVFTDIPPKEDVEGAQVVIENPNTFAPEEALPDAGAWVVEPEEADGATGTDVSYAELDIVSPQHDEAVRENTGNVSIVTNVKPQLRPGHTMRLMLDGTVVQEGRQTTFELANVDRGTHQVSLDIVDDDQRVLIRSSGVTFHLLRYAIPPKKPAPSG